MALLLSALVSLTAALSCRALGLRRFAETLVAGFCIANALVLTAVHGLGLAFALRRTPLLLATLAVCALPLLALAATRGPRTLLADARALARLPLDAARSVRGPLARLALALVGAVLLHAVIGAVRLPSDAWDGIWYHDTIVGGTLELGGYGVIPLPKNLLQQANGFPRNAEMVSLWLVAFSDRSLIELPNALSFAPFVAATYMIASRFTRDRQTALALSSAACLLPGAILELRSTYVDVYAAQACLAAIAFATRRPLRARDAVLAGLSLAIFVGAKISALLVAPALLLLLVMRATHLPWKVRAACGFALAATAAAFSLVYARNALLFGNPLYPIAIEAPRLGFHWPGIVDAAAVDVNPTWAELAASIFVPSQSGRDFADIRRGGFGLAVAWLVLPLACLGVGRALAAAARRLRPQQPSASRTRARWLLVTCALLGPSLVLSPALWSARYHLAAVGVSVAPAAFALAQLRARWLTHAAIACALLLDVIAIARFDPPLGAPTDFTLEPGVAQARERELGPGSVVVFGEGVTFPSVLYNERFDNRLAFVADEGPRALARELSRLDPTWVVAAPSEPLYRYVGERPEMWQLVGLASRGNPTYAFRRLRKPVPSAAN